jgi:hypothetical protein
MIYRSSRELPQNLRGYALWLQCLDAGVWSEVCCLRPADARQVARWLDRHPLRTNLRISAVTV